MEKNLLIVTSFGTTHEETCDKNIGAVERALAAAFPDWAVRRAFTSGMVHRAVRETRISPDAFILPLYIDEKGGKEEISSLPGQFRYGPDRVAEEVEAAPADGVNSFLLFGIPDEKDELGSGAWTEKGGVQTALGSLKKAYPKALFITDVCMCEHTSHGHCGALRGEEVDNAAALELLAKTALSHARAGADMVAPDTLTARYNSLDTVERLFKQNPDQIACVIVEPVAANMGVVPPAAGEALARVAEARISQ